jgi:hypothetical protein
VHDDRNGHACIWDFFESYTQNEASDTIRRIVSKGKSRRSATARTAFARKEGILSREAFCKVEPSTVAERREPKHPNQFESSWFFEKFKEENCVFFRVDKCEECFGDPHESHCEGHC